MRFAIPRRALVLSAVLAALAASVLYGVLNFTSAADQARDAATRLAVHSAAIAVECFADETGALPSPAQGLQILTIATHASGPLLKDNDLLDDWGRSLRYAVDGTSFTITSAGIDGIFGTRDDIAIDRTLQARRSTVRVAAVQFPSIMGRTADNLAVITNLVRRAAAGGARIVVLPECAVQGYMDPTEWRAWLKSETGSNGVQTVAEPVPGPSTASLAELARELDIYLCAGIVEAATNGYFNSQVLISPQGAIVAHHRKRTLWTPGDSTWCTPGHTPVQVVDTEFGRLGLMICYDFHTLPPLLAGLNADIVLYSVGWYGPNERQWFAETFPRKAVIPYGFDIIAANWTSATEAQAWPGRGHSCIVTGRGKVLAMSEAVSGNDIVMADLVIRERQDPSVPNK